MADVKEKDLSAKTTLGTSDYLRVVGSDNASYKQLVSDVAKCIVENYTGSTIAGSAQSIKSALDNLNSNAIGHKLTQDKELASGTDINTLTTPGSYIVPNSTAAATMQNWPSTAGGRLEVISILRDVPAASDARLKQFAFMNASYDVYQRTWSGTWSTWKKFAMA